MIIEQEDNKEITRIERGQAQETHVRRQNTLTVFDSTERKFYRIPADAPSNTLPIAPGISMVMYRPPDLEWKKGAYPKEPNKYTVQAKLVVES
jgi:hypothetical protein